MSEKNTTVQKSKERASVAAMQRMPSYLRYLHEIDNRGQLFVSSVELSEYLGLSAIAVKKDLAFVRSSDGKPRVGFKVKDLISDIQNFLGYNSATNAVLIGAGGLGKTLLGYDGFKNYGLNIVAAFDKEVDTIGSTINDKIVFDVKELPEFLKKNNILIAIIAVPRNAAQSICDVLIQSGIKGIWNFAPTRLKVPLGIAVRNEDMAAGLAVLSGQMKAMI